MKDVKSLSLVSKQIYNYIFQYKFDTFYVTWEIISTLDNKNVFRNINNFDDDLNKLPSSITSLSFGYYFNQSVDKLPDSIEELNFHEESNIKINKYPKNLKYLNGKLFSNQKPRFRRFKI